jgi:tetratricopeptide (TPR) repeat protein
MTSFVFALGEDEKTTLNGFIVVIDCDFVCYLIDILDTRLHYLQNLLPSSIETEIKMKQFLQYIKDLTDEYPTEEKVWRFKKDAFANIVVHRQYLPLIMNAIDEDTRFYPKSVWPLWLKAFILVVRGIYGDEKPNYQSVYVQQAYLIINDLLTNPEIIGTSLEPDLLMLKTFVFFHFSRTEEALKTVEELLKKPNLTTDIKTEALIMKANTLFMLNQPNEALITIEEAVQFNPSHPLTWQTKSEFLMKMRRYKEAVTAIETAVKLISNSNREIDPLTVSIHRMQIAIGFKERIPEERLLESCNILIPFYPSSLSKLIIFLPFFHPLSLLLFEFIYFFLFMILSTRRTISCLFAVSLFVMFPHSLKHLDACIVYLALRVVRGRTLYRLERFKEALQDFIQASQIIQENRVEPEIFEEFSLDPKHVMSELLEIIPKLEQSTFRFNVV